MAHAVPCWVKRARADCHGPLRRRCELEPDLSKHTKVAAVAKLTAGHMRYLHASLTLTWLLLGIPTMLWWKESIAWVAWMSLYANVASHWAAYQGARAEDNGNGGS